MALRRRVLAFGPVPGDAVMMRFPGRPISSAFCAFCIADTISASRMTSTASPGSGRRALSSIMRPSRSGSRLPQLTPMRTGLSYRHAVSIMVANWSSRFDPRPTLPGLIRYLSSTCAQSGYCVSSLCPLKWKSPISGTRQPSRSSRLRIAGTAAAASALLTVIRTNSEPASASSLTWRAVACTSAVSVLVIDCTTTGAPAPTGMPAMRTWRVS